MSVNEFWHGDTRLLTAYQQAYYTDKSYSAYQQANYVSAAVEVGIANAFADKPNKKKAFVELVKWTPPFKNEQEEKITQENLEEKFREETLKQHSWLHNILSHKK